MKKLLTCLALVVLYVPCAMAQHKALPKARLSAQTVAYLSACRNAAEKGGIIPNYVYKRIHNQYYVSGLVKVWPDMDESAINALGVYVGTKAGNIWTVQVPVTNVTAFTQVNGIKAIDLDAPIYPALDSARRQTHADSAHRGIYLPTPMTGKNVVVGIVDAGFDFNHPIFYDTSHGAYRVRKVWTQKVGGTPPAGFAYGNELADSDAIRARGYDTAIISHGTHVAGIAAGSGYGSSTTGSRFRGMAYESDIVLVGIMPATGEWINTGVSDIVDGMSYIYTYATSVGKPAVVNLSWGATLGPHDGNSLFSQACDNLTGAGKIFVCAAGNNGVDTVHLQKNFTAVDSDVHTFVTFSPYLDSNTQSTYVDLWGDTGKTFCVNVRLFDTTSAIDSTGFVCMSVDSTYNYKLIGSNGDTCFVTVTTVPVEFNDKPHTFIFLHSKVHDNICLTTRAAGGTVHMWEGYVLPPEGYYGYFKQLGYPWAVSGDTKYTVSDIGCTRSAITTGAYASKLSFRNIDGTNLGYGGSSYGHIAYFSSLGPTEDQRIKPDITAPGFALASAVSSYDTSYNVGGANYIGVIAADTDLVSGHTYRYAMLAGTSMASPCAAGIVAMMLQMNPTLTPDSVKSIINATAIKDVYTGVLPATGTTTWGHGKINAYRVLRYIAGNLSVANVHADVMDCLLYPNPNKGTFTLSYNSKTAEQLSITVYDIAGKLVHAENWWVNAGANSKVLDMTGLAPGVYFTKVRSADSYHTIKTVIE